MRDEGEEDELFDYFVDCIRLVAAGSDPQNDLDQPPSRPPAHRIPSHPPPSLHKGHKTFTHCLPRCLPCCLVAILFFNFFTNFFMRFSNNQETNRAEIFLPQQSKIKLKSLREKNT